MNLYTFTLEKLHIDNTRSRHNDTDTVSLTVEVGKGPMHSKTLSMGDVNNGDHGIGLEFQLLIADTTVPFVVSYAVYNGDTSKLPKALSDLTQATAANALDDILDPSPPTSGPADYGSGPDGGDPWNEPGSANVGWLTELSYLGIADFIFPDCDGFVAMDTLGTKVETLNQAIDGSSNGLLRKSVRYPGTNSAAGCGSNSDYTITWSVLREAIRGSVRQFLKSHALNAASGLRSLS